MASRLTPDDHARRREALIADFNDGASDIPCQYCGETPTRAVEIVPAEYKQGRLTHRPHFADLCWTCMRRLKIDRADREYAQRQAAGIKQHQAWAREDARAEIEANQITLPGLESGPGNALTGG